MSNPIGFNPIQCNPIQSNPPFVCLLAYWLACPLVHKQAACSCIVAAGGVRALVYGCHGGDETPLCRGWARVGVQTRREGETARTVCVFEELPLPESG